MLTLFLIHRIRGIDEHLKKEQEITSVKERFSYFIVFNLMANPGVERTLAGWITTESMDAASSTLWRVVRRSNSHRQRPVESNIKLLLTGFTLESELLWRTNEFSSSTLSLSLTTPFSLFSFSSGWALQRGKDQVKWDYQLWRVHPDGDAATCWLQILKKKLQNNSSACYNLQVATRRAYILY